MPGIPYAERGARTQARIAALEAEIAQGASTPGLRGALNLLKRRRATYAWCGRTPTEPVPGRFYSLEPFSGRRRMPVPRTAPDLGVDLREVVP